MRKDVKMQSKEFRALLFQSKWLKKSGQLSIAIKNACNNFNLGVCDRTNTKHTREQNALYDRHIAPPILYLSAKNQTSQGDFMKEPNDQNFEIVQQKILEINASNEPFAMK